MLLFAKIDMLLGFTAWSVQIQSFMVHIFLHSDWIRTRKNSVFGHFSLIDSFPSDFGVKSLIRINDENTRERSIPPEHRIQDVIWTCLCTFNLLLCPRGRATSLLLTLKRYLLLGLPPSFFVFIVRQQSRI